MLLPLYVISDYGFDRASPKTLSLLLCLLMNCADGGFLHPVEGASRSKIAVVRSEEEAAKQHAKSVPRLATLEEENQQTLSSKENDTSLSPSQQRKQAPAHRYQLRPEAPVFFASASRPSGFPGIAASALNPAASSFVASSGSVIAAPRPNNPRVAGTHGITNSSSPAQHSQASRTCSQPSPRSATLFPSKSSLSKLL